MLKLLTSVHWSKIADLHTLTHTHAKAEAFFFLKLFFHDEKEKILPQFDDLSQVVTFEFFTANL